MNTRPSYESATKTLSLDWTEDNIGLVTFNDTSKSVNAFSRPILEDLGHLLDVALGYSALSGLVFRSGKTGSFAAGVDISIFDTLTTAESGASAARTLQELFGRLENPKVNTVAAIDGVCLGGGLELALACHHRVASSRDSTKLGLPEVQLGLLPGGGGTQRLPRLVGITEALGLILTGRQIDGRKAKKIGLVVDVVPPNQLLDAALKVCREAKPFKRKSTLSLLDDRGNKSSLDVNRLALEGTPFGRALIKRKSADQVGKTTKGHYPAPLKALESVMWGITRPFEDGLANEAKLFGELVASSESRALIHVFRMMTAAKKNPCASEDQDRAQQTYMAPLKNGASAVGIIGAGLMGSGIATVLSGKGIRTVLEDRDGAGVGRGLAAIAGHYDERVRKRRMRPAERSAALGSVCPATDLRAMAQAPIVIEAVFEDVQLKRNILKQCEAACPSHAIFATNTSSIPITAIAAEAQHPERVVGMHFFSPVPKMPLVEIIRTPITHPRVVAAAFELAAKMGKNIIVVNDGPGFYTTRILAFFINEALCLLDEGAAIDDIDRALESFGMPVGPITLLDEVGIDVGSHIIRVLTEAFGQRLIVPSWVANIETEGRKGRKNAHGFYRYEDGKKSGVDDTIYKHMPQGTARLSLDGHNMAERCLYVFLNEAARCLSEGILSSADDGDMGAVFGLGFPPFLGGPFHYARELGRDKVRENLLRLAEKHGSRFAPDAYWSR
jgi:3-hydroxyacyl-CoA dehydrogenase/enoyl-CoA hydratase/3-hydroxybutyryl-CoA epimerase